MWDVSPKYTVFARPTARNMNIDQQLMKCWWTNISSSEVTWRNLVTERHYWLVKGFRVWSWKRWNRMRSQSYHHSAWILAWMLGGSMGRNSNVNWTMPFRPRKWTKKNKKTWENKARKRTPILIFLLIFCSYRITMSSNFVSFCRCATWDCAVALSKSFQCLKAFTTVYIAEGKMGKTAIVEEFSFHRQSTVTGTDEHSRTQ